MTWEIRLHHTNNETGEVITYNKQLSDEEVELCSTPVLLNHFAKIMNNMQAHLKVKNHAA
jgi:hypothetical protein